MRRVAASTMERMAVLKNVPLFAGLAFDHMVLVARSCSPVRHGAGEHIFFEGTQADSLYIVMDGRVQIYRGAPERPVVLEEMGPADVFGDMALFDDGLRSASIRTVEPTILLRLARVDFQELLFYHPAVALDAVRLLSHRVRAMSEKLEEVLSARVQQDGPKPKKDTAARTMVMRGIRPGEPVED